MLEPSFHNINHVLIINFTSPKRVVLLCANKLSFGYLFAKQGHPIRVLSYYKKFS